MTDELKSAVDFCKKEIIEKDSYNLRTAYAYLDAIEDAEEMYGEDGVKVQLRYVLANLGGWKGDDAKRIKKIFRECVK